MPEKIAILGGNRIPFARSNGPYAEASNQDMLTAALDGLVARFGLQGERAGEVVAGAVLKHSRDFNLTRECVLGSALDHSTPAYDLQLACGTGLQAALAVGGKIALGQIEWGIAGGVDTTSDAPIAVNEDLRRLLLRGQPHEVRPRPPEAARAPATRPDRARDPAQRRAAHRHVDGRAPGDHHRALRRHARGAGRAHGRQPPGAGRRLRARLLRRPRDPLPRARARPEPAPGQRAPRSWPS